MLNNLHLNILAVFSEINKNNVVNDDKNMRLQYVDILKSVFSDVRCFYKETKNNKKRIDDFKNNKNTEIEIHEIITRIFSNMTKLPESLNLIGAEDTINEDIIDFLIKLSNVKKDNKSIMDTNKKKKRNPEELKKNHPFDC